MKKKLISFVIMMCFLFGACTSKNTAIIEKDAIVKEYLTNVFTTDYESRYTNLLNKGMSEENLNKTYKSFETIVTEKCIEDMKNARIPLSYDQLFCEQGRNVVPNIKTIKEASVKEDYIIYDFELDLIEDNAPVQEISGQVTIDLSENKISHLFIR